MLKRIKQVFNELKGLELIGSKRHPPGFDLVRAEYINSRVRILALLFSVLTPLWIPVDYFILPKEDLASIIAARLLFSLSLLALWLKASHIFSLRRARLRLVVLMVMPALFHLSTQFILGDHLADERLASYSFLPFLIIAIHCVFPLTLKEGCLLALFTIVTLSLDELIRLQLFSLTSLNSLWLLSVIMAIAIWAQLSQLHMQLKLFEQATTDTLTGLLTRRAFMTLANAELSRAERYGRPLTVALLDLDHFKQINDTYGHQTGDNVLMVFANILRQQLRTTDLAGRFGGEEFILILPETSIRETEKVITRILSACRTYALDYQGKQIRFTASAGISEVLVDIPSSLQYADKALYEAKATGRDRSVTAQNREQEPNGAGPASMA